MGICKSKSNVTIIDNKKYDMDELLKFHPGGKKSIEKILNKDGTLLYRNCHGTQYDHILNKYLIKYDNDNNRDE
jgi:cytochrome b involved in lipid metabolism